MSESKECHLNNNDILSNCLDLMKSSGNHKQNTDRSAAGACIAYGNSLERKLLENELKEVWE